MTLFPEQQIIAVGLDPGKTGAVAALRDGAVQFYDTPTLATGVGGKRDYDVHEMAAIIRRCGDLDRLHVFIEKQQAMPMELHGRTQGVATSFQIGLGYGVWLGLLGALGVPFTPVAAVTWKKVMLSDMPKGKDSSTIKAKQLFPQAAESLKRKKDHNRSEALLLAEYGRRCLGR